MVDPLVEHADVAAWLQRPVNGATATLAISMAESWVRPVLSTLTWPPSRDEHPDVWAAVVELAGIAVDNPTGMRSSTSGGVTDEWQVARRAEILADLEARWGGAQPLGSFPPAQAWPG